MPVWKRPRFAGVCIPYDSRRFFSASFASNFTGGSTRATRFKRLVPLPHINGLVFGRPWTYLTVPDNRDILQTPCQTIERYSAAAGEDPLAGLAYHREHGCHRSRVDLVRDGTLLQEIKFDGLISRLNVLGFPLKLLGELKRISTWADLAPTECQSPQALRFDLSKLLSAKVEVLPHRRVCKIYYLFCYPQTLY